MTDIDVDVLVAGAGPIGLAAAIEARLEGLSVVIVEPRSFPVDKACGEGLMPGAVAALERLGVKTEGASIAGFRYADERRATEYRFRGQAGRGVRRTALHDALAARADELGVARVDARVGTIEQDARGVSAAGVRASWLLGCDGLHSTVRRTAGLEQAAKGSASKRRYGLSRHFAMAPWSDLVEVHWGPRAEAYVTPLADDLVGVAVLGPQLTSFDETISEIPELARRLVGAQPVGSLRGAGPLLQRATARTSGRVLLLGDASGYVDALTGEGIRVGLGHARAAIAAISGVDGHPAAVYEREWRRVSRDFRMLTGGLLAAAQSPVRPLIVPAARALPAAFGAVVERLAR
ncbi:NAD(P)/FAD-dependent oxidoreductase [Agreia sp. COWG]|uniref:NAD(P)/FAD-dependent oxidoreductase n=1 Tax=Agreia sp. COWG TaxID=2773266 RepID=UPI001927F7D8|nr:NAD(P)/FAD-dependent oxidoreductase [Agreia sp. COWG]CAD5995855.1 Dehydrogenase (Flavoprotein) [Agreia sp. COWG]